MPDGHDRESGVKLPNGERAFVDAEKLRRYCLDPSHPRGRHKARVFASALGLSASEAEVLRTNLQKAAADGDVVPGVSDRHGSRYTLDIRIEYGSRTAMVRSHWIVRRNEDFPRLVSCYVT
jgi:hypothetical protein